jgi:hypothetical protein
MLQNLLLPNSRAFVSWTLVVLDQSPYPLRLVRGSKSRDVRGELNRISDYVRRNRPVKMSAAAANRSADWSKALSARRSCASKSEKGRPNSRVIRCHLVA